MNNRDKVIKGLKCCMEGVKKCRECPYYPIEIECLETLADDALEMLKELEVKTVLYMEKRLVIQVKAMSGFCPKCSHTLIYGMNKHFCGNCGQAVKWDA